MTKLLTRIKWFKRGFTLVELMVVVGIIAILVGLVSINLMQSARNSRNAERKQDVRALSQALTAYGQRNGNFFVLAGGGNCTGIADIDAQMTGTGCTGANGRSYGLVNMISKTTSNFSPPETNNGSYNGRTYANTSIASALVTGGFLSKANTDPQVDDPKVENKPDYVLVRCCYGGKQSFGKASDFFAFWTKLEGGEATTTEEKSLSANYCGGLDSRVQVGSDMIPYDYASGSVQYPGDVSFSNGNAAPRSYRAEASSCTDLATR